MTNNFKTDAKEILGLILPIIAVGLILGQILIALFPTYMTWWLS